ncbi:GAF domain-containing protein [Leptolyngbya sp. FACHB-261]|uniref:GAF domain-containing protein n=1 Tax=Leptolyngbya sp. FACHB-261 TaxID=2692806 RepID=UPI001685EDA4|nr:GAF domain-containing protein [Leptolyngbya sp. FACHB-261]MBD2102655.1 GAF domain-containing protein [Leptolyngbya sp. FACHB-261]
MAPPIDLAQQVSALQQENEHLRAQLIQLQQEQAQLHRQLATATQEAADAKIAVCETARREASARQQEKVAQERAAELAISSKALQQTIDTLGSLNNFEDFIPAVLTIVARTFKTTSCGYYEHNQDEVVYLRYWFSKGRVLNPLELQLLDPQQYQVLRRLANGFTVPLEHLKGTTVRNRTRPVIIDHRCADTVPDFHTFAVSQGWPLEMNQPLVVDGKADGALVIYREASQPFSESELRLSEALAKQLALAMQASRLSTQARNRAVEAAIAREQEKAAHERAAELAKANETLRRSVERMASDTRLETLVSAFLIEATETVGADAAAVMLRIPGSLKFAPAAVVEDGHLLSPEELASDPYLSRYVEFSSSDVDGIFSTLARGETPSIRVENLHEVFPEAYAYHQRHRHCIIWHAPLRLRGEVIGFAGIALREDRLPSNAVGETVAALAQQLTLALELTRLADESKQAAIACEQEQAAQKRAAELERINTELQQSKQRLQDLLNTMSDWAWEVDANGIYTFVDEKVSKILGYSPNEMLGKTPFDFMPRDEAAQVLTTFSNIAAKRQSFSRLKNHNLAKDGNEVIFETSGTPMFDLEGNFSGYRGADCDVTELRRVQDALLQAEQERAAELAKANEALSRTSSRLAEQPDLAAFLGHIMLEAVAQLEADGGHLTIYDQQRQIISTAVLVEQGKVVASPDFPPDMPISEVGFIQLIRETRKLRYFDLESHFEQDAHLLWQEVGEHHKRHNHLVGVAIPLFIGDEFLGHFGLAFTDKKILNEQGTELLQALANQAALAIQLTRLAEEAKQTAIAREQEKAAQERATELAKANEALARASERLADQPDLSAFLSHITLEAIAQLGADAGMLTVLDEQRQVLRAVAHVEQDHIPVSTLAMEMPVDAAGFVKVLQETRKPRYFNLEQEAHLFWQGSIEYHHQHDHQAVIGVPLYAGGSFLGHLGLAFTHTEPIKEQGSELLYALAQQAALAIQLTHLAEEAKQAAIVEERNRIARDIHDTLAQSFTAISIQLDLAKVLDPNTSTAACQAISYASQLAKTGLAEARRSVWALQPDAAQYQDLVAVLRRSLAQFTKGTALQAEMDIQGIPYSVSPEVGMNLLRITQEAVNNTLRHAEAGMILVELHYQPHQLMLRIQDDGKGFAPSQQSDSGGFGLLSMQQRAKRLNAQCSICSHPGDGTEIFVQVPIALTGGNA